MLKESVNKGSDWLKKFHRFSLLNGLSRREGREVATCVIEPLFNDLEPNYLKELIANEDLQDKLNGFIIAYINKKNSPLKEDEWEKWAYPLSEHEDLEQYDVEFIKLVAPKFDWSVPYTRKKHRQLIKIMKASFRNTDGAIKDELGNRAVNLIKQTLEMDNNDMPEDILQDAEALDYIVDYVINCKKLAGESV